MLLDQVSSARDAFDAVNPLFPGRPPSPLGYLYIAFSPCEGPLSGELCGDAGPVTVNYRTGRIAAQKQT